MRRPTAAASLRALAVFEAAKGLLVLLVGCGIAGILHHRARHFVEVLVHHFHLNPAHHTPQVFLALAENFDNTRLWALAGGAAAYAFIRFAEAYGLWRQRRWAEWLGCVGAAIYLPLELHDFIDHPGLISAIVLGTNLLIVAYLGIRLWKGRNRRKHRHGRESEDSPCEEDSDSANDDISDDGN